jgi:DNA-binding helix-hairpin-helix protein with protein kinase domain
MNLLRSSDAQEPKVRLTVSLGVGGEARIYAVADAPDLAAKMYHRPGKDHAAKLTAMLANRPEDPLATQGHVSIAWPTELLVAGDGTGRVLGFLMPRVVGMNPIIDFYHPRTRRRKHPLFNHRYLLRTARNLAACVSAIHARGYVIGDLNESNILVEDTALVTLVDTDSFQVPDATTGRVHRCRVGKPEFTPPELQQVRFDWVDRKPEHDLFGLGVLVFHLLMEGIHPFAGRHLGPGEPPSLAERISAGLFPYAFDRRQDSRPMPTSPPFELLDPNLQELFLRCFVTGHTSPAVRPPAQAWQQALAAAEATLVVCPYNVQHLYGHHLTSCPWCERRELLQGIDSFPSEADLRTGQVRHLALRPRRQISRRSVDYQTAVGLAEADIDRRRWQQSATTLVIILASLGLVAYWLWGMQFFLPGR